MMIDYVVKYQNSYVYSHLFQKNIEELIDKEVKLNNLFSSDIFNLTFDYDEWPATSPNTDRLQNPYNGSIFKLRSSYQDVYPELCN